MGEDNKSEFDNIDFSKLTEISAILSLCLKCETKDDAKKVLEQYEKYCHTPEIARINLGYIFGYMSEEDRKKLYSLFPLDHPIFGHSFGRSSDSAVTDALERWVEDTIKK